MNVIPINAAPRSTQPFARLMTLVRENRALKDEVARQLVELADLRQKLRDTEEAAARMVAEYDRELTAALGELDEARGLRPGAAEELRLLREEACSG